MRWVIMHKGRSDVFESREEQSRAITGAQQCHFAKCIHSYIYNSSSLIKACLHVRLIQMSKMISFYPFSKHRGSFLCPSFVV